MVEVVTIHLHRPGGQPGGVARVVSAVHGVAAVVTPPGAPPPAPGVRVGRVGPGRVAPVLLVVVTKHLGVRPDRDQDMDSRLCLVFIIPCSSDSLAGAGPGHFGTELTCNTAIYHHRLNNHHQACQNVRPLVGLGQTILEPTRVSWCLPWPRQS